MMEKDALLILNASPGLGNSTIRRLLEHFGSARNILALPEKDFREGKIVPATAVQKIFEFDRDKFLDREYNLMLRHRVNTVTCFDEAYPAMLKLIPDAPVVLYYCGELPSSSDVALAIVGSRRASVYGIMTAEKFSRELAERGVTVVSGLAKGIDTSAHRGCLQVRGKTVAVLGCGLAHVYPRENKELCEKIPHSGAVVSELPMDTPPLAYHFPRRNRVISGLSQGVLVVEASLQSGALVTSRFALEQGREVFAIPGKIDYPNTRGTHRLIQQGAKLVGCIEDIMEELRAPEVASWKIEDRNALETVAARIPFPELSPEERRVYEKLSDQPVDVDALLVQVGSSAGGLMTTLMNLELKRCVKQLPGKMFVRSS